jgi:hypothetical protein
MDASKGVQRDSEDVCEKAKMGPGESWSDIDQRHMGSSSASFAKRRGFEAETECICGDVEYLDEDVCSAPWLQVSTTAKQLRKDEVPQRQAMCQRQDHPEVRKSIGEQKEGEDTTHRYGIDLSGSAKHAVEE